MISSWCGTGRGFWGGRLPPCLQLASSQDLFCMPSLPTGVIELSKFDLKSLPLGVSSPRLGYYFQLSPLLAVSVGSNEDGGGESKSMARWPLARGRLWPRVEAILEVFCVFIYLFFNEGRTESGKGKSR